MDPIGLLDRAKTITGSDAATAREIGVKQQRLDHVRSGHTRMSPWMAGRIAELIGKDPIQASIEAHTSNAPNFKEKKDWKRWAKLARVSTVVGFSSAIILYSMSYSSIITTSAVLG